MTRAIPRSLSGILEDLELSQPTLVTSDDLRHLTEQNNVKTPVNVVASRLRERGWLLPTVQRGIWEFAPASVAGPYSRSEPTLPFQAFLAKHPSAPCALTFQAAAWAHGIADRAPARLEVAAASLNISQLLPQEVNGTVFTPRIDYERHKNVPVLAKESVLTHLAFRPTAVRSWASAVEWLPALAAELDEELLHTELAERPASVAVRAGYLLQSLRPDISRNLFDSKSVSTKVWFGARGPLKRHDSMWQIADTLLPINPRDLRKDQ